MDNDLETVFSEGHPLHDRIFYDRRAGLYYDRGSDLYLADDELAAYGIGPR